MIKIYLFYANDKICLPLGPGLAAKAESLAPAPAADPGEAAPAFVTMHDGPQRRTRRIAEWERYLSMPAVSAPVRRLPDSARAAMTAPRVFQDAARRHPAPARTEAPIAREADRASRAST